MACAARCEMCGMHYVARSTLRVSSGALQGYLRSRGRVARMKSPVPELISGRGIVRGGVQEKERRRLKSRAAPASSLKRCCSRQPTNTC